MTFATYETSAQSGAPIELYEFAIGPTVYRYASGPDDYTYLTKPYLAAQIARGEIEETNELPKNELTVTIRRDAEVADLFRVAPPSDLVMLTIFRLHYDDPDQQRITLWTGRVLNVEWNGPAATLTCESIFTALRRPGLRRIYGRNCPHVLFGAACGLVDTAHKVPATLSASTGGTATSATFGGQADGWWAGGWLEWESSPGRYERRSIRLHAGDVVTFTHPIPDLPAGAAVFIWPGCDHTKDTCASKFGNILNYGGFPYVPKKNPFGGSNPF